MTTADKSNTVITEAGALAYISADDVEEALQRLDGAILARSIGGVRAIDDETPVPYCCFAFDGRVLVN